MAELEEFQQLGGAVNSLLAKLAKQRNAVTSPADKALEAYKATRDPRYLAHFEERAVEEQLR